MDWEPPQDFWVLDKWQWPPFGPGEDSTGEGGHSQTNCSLIERPFLYHDTSSLKELFDFDPIVLFPGIYVVEISTYRLSPTALFIIKQNWRNEENIHPGGMGKLVVVSQFSHTVGYNVIFKSKVDRQVLTWYMINELTGLEMVCDTKLDIAI